MRRFLRRHRPEISGEDWQRIVDDANAARELIEMDRFEFMRAYFSQSQESITRHFVENTIKPVRERIKISDVLTKILSTSKQEQQAELSGEYKAYDKFMRFLHEVANFPDQCREAQERGEIIIQNQTDEG